MRSPTPEHVLTPSIFAPWSGVIAAVSTRNGGSSPPPYGMNLSFTVGDTEQSVLRNRQIFFRSMGIPTDALAIPQQVHGTVVRQAEIPGPYPECDALITRCQNLFLCVTVADCVPILLYDPCSDSLAAVHAGWRGTVGRIGAKAVQMMESQFGALPAEIRAYLGPAAGRCCYYVGAEVSTQFDPRFRSRDSRGETVDLRAVNVDHLTSAGVPPDHIEVDPRCTISEPALFHSHRRDGARSGRMMAVIGKPHPNP